MQFSEVNTECTKKIIGNDLIMNFYPVFVGKHTHYKNESIVNLWGGDDSITINTTNGRLLSFCYLKSLIYLIEKNEISLEKIKQGKSTIKYLLITLGLFMIKKQLNLVTQIFFIQKYL